MPSNMSEERIAMMKFYGAELIQVEEGDFDGAIEMRDDLCKAKGWFNCNQFHNRLNMEAHYKNTGPEIWSQYTGTDIISYHRDKIDAFVAGTGTGGTIMGCGMYLKEKNPKIKVGTSTLTDEVKAARGQRAKDFATKNKTDFWTKNQPIDVSTGDVYDLDKYLNLHKTTRLKVDKITLGIYDEIKPKNNKIYK